MKIRPMEIVLNTGEKVILRSVKKQDALQMLRSFHQWSAETEFLLRTPMECTMTLQEEEELLASYVLHPLRTMIVAQKGEEIIASASVYPRRELFKCAHRGVLGIAIQEAQWGKGLGTQMIKKSIETAKRMGFVQLELEVFSDNERALKLYEKLGFKEYGRCPQGVRKLDGSFMDEISMVKIL